MFSRANILIISNSAIYFGGKMTYKIKTKSMNTRQILLKARGVRKILAQETNYERGSKGTGNLQMKNSKFFTTFQSFFPSGKIQTQK